MRSSSSHGFSIRNAGHALAAVALAACQQTLPDGSEQGASYLGAVSIALLEELPTCDAATLGVVYYVEETAEFMYCDGTTHQPLDLGGEVDATWLIEAKNASATKCEHGGAVIWTGPDLNGNQVLDSDEVTQKRPVCNGAPGADGSGCSAVDNGDGSLSISCGDGTEVTFNQAEEAALPVMRVTREAPGNQCQLGGNLIEIGLDADNDGELTDEEVTDSAYACEYIPQVVAIATGGLHSCALRDDGSVKCWGDNYRGKLGLGDAIDRGGSGEQMGDELPVVNLGTGRKAIAIAAGGDHSCALLEGGSVKCWGNNDHGQLGVGHTNHRGDEADEMGDELRAVSLGAGRKAIAIAAGAAHNCALLDDGSVKCWGSNGNGQLGLGDTDDRGDDPAETGDTLPAVSLGTGRTALAIRAGASHTCALLNNARVKCWGWNFSGQLGVGDANSRGDAAGEMGDALPAVGLGPGLSVVAIGAGGQQSCALLLDGRVKCWGQNLYGQLGLGDTNNRGDGAGEMGDALPAVSLGTGRTALGLTVGSNHNCVLLDDGSVKCWGRNTYGQLGLGDTSNRGDGAGEMGDVLPAVNLGTDVEVSLGGEGGEHSCALLGGGTVKCWGDNVYGQLGLGDVGARGDGPNEMGDFLPFVQLGER